MGATSETLTNTKPPKMMKMPYYPQSLVQLNANKVGLVQIRREQHRGSNSGSDEGGEYRSAVEEKILI